MEKYNKNKVLAELDFAMLSRLKNYVKGLRIFAIKGKDVVSVHSLAEQQGVNSSVVQNDLLYVGISDGVKEIYEVESLIYGLSNRLGCYRVDEACLIGTGKLAQSVLNCDAYKKCRIRIVAAFDVYSSSTITPDILGVKVLDLSHLGDIVRRMNLTLAIVAVPEMNMKEVEDEVFNTSLRLIWNFSPVILKEADNVKVVNSTLTSDVQSDYRSLIKNYGLLA